MKLAWEEKGERWAVRDGCRGPQTIFSPRRFPLLSKATAHTVDWCPSSVAKEDLEGEGVGVGGREGGVQCGWCTLAKKALKHAMHVNG